MGDLERRDDTPDAYALIRFELDWIGKHFASRDDQISDLEAAFLGDIAVFLGEVSYDDLSNRTLSEIAQRQFIENPALYDQ